MVDDRISEGNSSSSSTTMCPFNPNPVESPVSSAFSKISASSFDGARSISSARLDIAEEAVIAIMLGRAVAKVAFGSQPGDGDDV